MATWNENELADTAFEYLTGDSSAVSYISDATKLISSASHALQSLDGQVINSDEARAKLEVLTDELVESLKALHAAQYYATLAIGLINAMATPDEHELNEES